MDRCAHDLPRVGAVSDEEELELLNRRGALELPPEAIQIALLQAYFAWFHPCHQILDEAELWKSFREGNTSVFLLQSMLFVAATFCDESTIRSHWSSRREAEQIFFKRAKALYDADHESNHLTVIQGLFLMSFWWAGPTDQKEFGHWLGAAIRLAQYRGMHRSYG